MCGFVKATFAIRVLMKKSCCRRTMSKKDEFIQRIKDIHRIGSIQGHLGWDQETLMPVKGAKSRGEIMAWLAALAHERIIDPEMGELLDRVEQRSDLDEAEQANTREFRKRYDKATKLSSNFVSTFAKARSEALVAWQGARSNSDFSAFLPHLETLVALTREKIEAYGYEGTPYDALLDEYESGMTVEDYDPLFAGLKQRLVPLLHRIMEAKKTNPDPTLPEGMAFPVESQEQFCIKVSERMGFDFAAGRMDASTHPFSAGIWPGDTRFTTRYDEFDPFSCLYAVMHETGHALYEQGLDENHQYTPRGDAVSLGVHESQSRLWENQIGRTPEFWDVAMPWFKESFPDAPSWDSTTLNRIANCVEPGFIRVEADEVTYNLHVMLRYEIEKKIFNEDFPLNQLPELWNSMITEWFGITVPNDTLGCLQDIHWSMAAFGYFPTYTLGNLYAAQLLEAMDSDIGSINQHISSGDWSEMLEWLRNRIHKRGSALLPVALIEEATGAPPSSEAFLRYVEEKYGAIYSL